MKKFSASCGYRDMDAFLLHASFLQTAGSEANKRSRARNKRRYMQGHGWHRSTKVDARPTNRSQPERNTESVSNSQQLHRPPSTKGRLYPRSQKCIRSTLAVWIWRVDLIGRSRGDSVWQSGCLAT